MALAFNMADARKEVRSDKTRNVKSKSESRGHCDRGLAPPVVNDQSSELYSAGTLP